VIAYFDTSAIIPLLIDEPMSDLADTVWNQASWVVGSRLSYVEARSGLARAHRTGRLSSEELPEAVEGLGMLYRQFYQVEITAELVEKAGQLAEDLALRAYDAIQLASAFSLEFGDLVMVTGDQQLVAAARVPGLPSISTRKREISPPGPT